MMSPKKLVKKLAATRTRSVAEKGHFVAYTTDCERFALPLTFLCNPILQALLAVSEEEYGLPGNGPIMLPCDGASMEYLISLTQRSLSEDLRKALLDLATNVNISAIYVLYNFPYFIFHALKCRKFSTFPSSIKLAYVPDLV
ncbi:auxin-responsive protein SAUR62-like [Aristolochia californica]|uniref:auxin-responsive protein SAUR62-like n=1 Tax=Aristolochia californica TaxID=171875 RepID=UPI0035DD4FC4